MDKQERKVGRKRKYIDNRDFIVCYMTAGSIDEVAKSLNITRASVMSKATNLRKRGVKLPKRFGQKSKIGRELEIAQLNSLVIKYTRKSSND